MTVVHTGTPTRHRGKGKGTRKGSTGPHRGVLGRASRGEAGRSAEPHRGRPSRRRGLGKSFSGSWAAQGEPSYVGCAADQELAPLANMRSE